MTEPIADPLSQMRVRAKLVWNIGWVWLVSSLVGLAAAFSTGWIYHSFGRMLLVPAACFGMVAWIGLGARWALRAAPLNDQRLLTVGPFAKKILSANMAVVICIVVIWSWLSRSSEPIVGGAGALITGAIWLLGMLAAHKGMYVASLYTRPRPSDSQMAARSSVGRA